ncbi:MAG: GntR family transcriptional regulator [Lachnospiraceae bacterium]
MELKTIPKRETLKDDAYQAIKKAIYDNTLPPGTPLVEEQLSRQLGISRTPIRAALQQLVFDKLAVQDNTRHLHVSTLTDKDVHDMTVIRGALEPLALEEAAFPIASEKIAELEALLIDQRMALEGEKSDLIRYAELDREFHTALAACGDNDLLIETIRNVNSVMVRYNVLSGTLGSHVQEALEEHAQILEFLKKGEKDFAVVSLRNHIKKVSGRIMQK